MEIGPDKNHVGLIQFSEEHLTRTEYSFSEAQEKTAILQRLGEMRYHNGRATFTGAGLKIIMDTVRFFAFQVLWYLLKFHINNHET
jgi:hypothetical protein